MAGEALSAATVTALLPHRAAQPLEAITYVWHRLPIQMNRSGAWNYTIRESALVGLTRGGYYWD